MRLALRFSYLAIGTIVLPVFYLNVETVAIEHGWQAMLSNFLTGKADWLLAFAFNPWTINASYVLVGFLAGAWADASAKAWDANKPSKSSLISDLRLSFEDLGSRVQELAGRWRDDFLGSPERVIPIKLKSEANAVFLKAKALNISTPNVRGLEGEAYLATVANFVLQMSPLLTADLFKEAKKHSRAIARQRFKINEKGIL